MNAESCAARYQSSPLHLFTFSNILLRSLAGKERLLSFLHNSDVALAWRSR